MTTFRTRIPAVARFLLPAGALLLGACANYPEPDNIRFGESVQHTIYLQTTDANAATTPSLDGDKSREALRAYREPGRGPQAVSEQQVGFVSPTGQSGGQ